MACMNVVGITWTYSNRQDVADLQQRTRLWLMEDRQELANDRQVSVRSRSNSAVPGRVVDRLGVGVVQQIIQARQAGVPLKEIAKNNGISESIGRRMVHG